jgi:hypothetical protein
VIARLLIPVVMFATSCRHASPPPPVVEVPAPTLPVEPPWVSTRAAVQAAVDSGQFAMADSILTGFVQSEAGTADAGEAVFWRAMLRADPRNPAFSPASARAALEEYASSENPHRRNETTVMLRLLSLSDSLRASQANQRSAMELRDRARDEETQRLRDELARTQAELDRIKRRLGPPKP